MPIRDRMRSLTQYRDMTDDEFNEAMAKRELGVETNREFEKRIELKIKGMGEDYDLDDLKANDKLTLRALAQAFIQLEDLEILAFTIRTGKGMSDLDLAWLEKLNDMMNRLRKDISSLQNDLNITRRIRKGEGETSVVAELDRLRQKAKEFYEQKMFYVWCPSCKELLFTGWFLYPDESYNKIRLKCNRKLANDQPCGATLQVSSKELLEKKGINIEDVPEFFK